MIYEMLLKSDKLILHFIYSEQNTDERNKWDRQDNP